MMNYQINVNNEQNVYEIVETNTNQVVSVRASLLTARALVNHLNRGGGFDGWTPTFMVKNNFHAA